MRQLNISYCHVKPWRRQENLWWIDYWACNRLVTDSYWLQYCFTVDFGLQIVDCSNNSDCYETPLRALERQSISLCNSQHTERYKRFTIIPKRKRWSQFTVAREYLKFKQGDGRCIILIPVNSPCEGNLRRLQSGGVPQVAEHIQCQYHTEKIKKNKGRPPWFYLLCGIRDVKWRLFIHGPWAKSNCPW